MRVLWKILVLPLAASLVAACGSSVIGGGATGGSATGGSATGGSSATVVSTTPFSCGTTVCMAGEYCESYVPGTAPPGGGGPGYTCQPIPASCASNATCACIHPQTPTPDCTAQYGGGCSDDGAGHVAVNCHGA